jgi:hypothetical protein
MGALIAAFAVGTLWFWLLMLLSFIVITAFVENEVGTGATITLIITVLLLDLLCKVPVFKVILGHPLRTLELVALYFVLGAVWGVVKWVFYLKDNLSRYNEARVEFLKDKRADEMTPELASKFQDYLANNYRRSERVEINPQVAEHKEDILRWMTYWPFSGLWTIINDPVRKLFKVAFASIQGGLQKLSDRMFRNAIDEAEMAKAYNKAQQEERFKKGNNGRKESW